MLNVELVTLCFLRSPNPYRLGEACCDHDEADTCLSLAGIVGAGARY